MKKEHMTSNIKKLLCLNIACVALAGVPFASTMAQSPAVNVDGPTLNVTRYVIEGELPLSKSEIDGLVAPYIGEKRTLRDIEAAAGALEKAIRERGYTFHQMFVPVQKPVNGEVRLQVIGFKLGNVEVTGNEHFSTQNIRNSLTNLKEGEIPEVRTLGRDVTASNSNPAKQVTVTFKESSRPTTVDAVIRVQDSAPASFFTTLTGNQSISTNGASQNVYRLGGGFQHANLFDLDHVLTVSYTTDPGHFSAVSLFGAFYQIPIYGTGMNLSGYFTRSDVNSGTVQQGAGVFDVSGSGLFTGIRLSRALPRRGALQQTVMAGLEERFFRNSTTFGGVLLQPDVGSRVLNLQYAFNDEPSWGQLSGTLDYVVNIGGGAGNNDSNHVANGGTHRWDAWRYSLAAGIQSSGWNYTGRLKGQYSGKALVVGEQFGLGGANSVRGFSDRVVSGERGLQWNLEATGPGLFGKPVRPVIFVEGGKVHARATGTETLVGAGAGLRYTDKDVQIALDIAKALDRNTAEPAGRPVRMHLAVTYRF